MNELGSKFLDIAGAIIHNQEKFFDHKNFCKILIKSIKYNCECHFVFSEISKLFEDTFDFDDCHDILKEYLSKCQKPYDLEDMFVFLNENSSLNFSDYLKIIEMFIYERIDENDSYNEMFEICDLFLDCFVPNEDPFNYTLSENLLKLLGSLKKIPGFTTNLVKMYFERCRSISEESHIFFAFKVAERKDICEILLKSVPNHLLQNLYICMPVQHMIDIHKFPNSIRTDMYFRNGVTFRGNQEVFLNLLKQAKATSDDAVKIILNSITNKLFEIIDSKTRALVLKEVKYYNQWHIILKFTNQLKDSDIENIDKFNVYEALNGYIDGSIKIDTLGVNLELLNNSILLPKYFHIFVKAFADILKNHGQDEFDFFPLLKLFLLSKILKTRPLKFEMIEKLFYKLINSLENENYILNLYRVREIFFRDEIKLAFVLYFMYNKQMIKNIDFNDIKKLSDSKNNKTETKRSNLTSNTDDKNIGIKTNVYQEQNDFDSGLSQSNIKNNGENNFSNEANLVKNKDDEFKSHENIKNPINNKGINNLDEPEHPFFNLKSFISKCSVKTYKRMLATDPQYLTKELENISDKDITDCMKILLSKKSANRL